MKALILVDLQNDFVPGGALAVTNGDQIIPFINQLQNDFSMVVATQDWHPEKHSSFASTHDKAPGEIIKLNGIDQILWPDHCVQNTPGADFLSTLNTEKITKIFQKGINPEIDSYSGFFDNDHQSQTGMGDYLSKNGVTDVYLTGLATDYCVKFTALDAVKLGFNTHLFINACKGVELNPGDIEHALSDMRGAGVTLHADH